MLLLTAAGCAGAGGDSPSGWTATTRRGAAPGAAGPAGSTPAVPAPPASAPEFAALPGWGADFHAAAVPALRRSCERLLRQPVHYPVGPAGAAGTVADWHGPCRAAAELPPSDDAAARAFFERHFEPVRVGGDGDQAGLFTGYYEPILRGSWKRTATHSVPLYAAPAKSKRMPTRAQIQKGALAGRGLELMWVDDPMDAFFLEVQGSGRVRMTDGTIVGVDYASQNGHAYFPIGKALIRWGEVDAEAMSMGAIRDWLKRNPDRARALLAMNRSHVFFKLREGEGARGAMGVPLTAGRSLAIDPKHLPMGAPMWIDVADAPTADRTIRRLVVAQDTGGAIKGAVRGDLFWGVGDEAGAAAGRMRARGRAWMLLPRERATATARASR